MSNHANNDNGNSPSLSLNSPAVVRGSSRMGRRSLAPNKSETITPPYQWATAQRAVVHSLQYLATKGINVITGRVKCSRCDKQFDIDYDLHAKFREVAVFIMKHRDQMYHRAPRVWMNPTLPDCRFCGQHGCAKPVLGKKRNIDWLFLFLGQMVGCCRLTELRYFCRHTRNHRTGAKDRVLFLTYMEICRQLDPQAAFSQ